MCPFNGILFFVSAKLSFPLLYCNTTRTIFTKDITDDEIYKEKYLFLSRCGSKIGERNVGNMRVKCKKVRVERVKRKMRYSFRLFIEMKVFF